MNAQNTIKLSMFKWSAATFMQILPQFLKIKVYDEKNTIGSPRPSCFPSLCVHVTLDPIKLPKNRS